MLDLLSSPSARRFESWAKGTKTNLARAELQTLEYEQLKLRLNTHNKAKMSSRKSLHKGGPIDVNALGEKKRVKEQKEQEQQFEKQLEQSRGQLIKPKKHTIKPELMRDELNESKRRRCQSCKLKENLFQSS